MDDLKALSVEQSRQWKAYLDQLRAESVGQNDRTVTKKVVDRLVESHAIDESEADAKRATLQKEYSEFRNGKPARVAAWFTERDALAGVVSSYAAVLATTKEEMLGRYRSIERGAADVGKPSWHPAFPSIVRGDVAVDSPCEIAGARHSPRAASSLERADSTIWSELRENEERPLVVPVTGVRGSGRRSFARALVERLGAAPAAADRSRSLGGELRREPVVARIAVDPTDLPSDSDVVLLISEPSQRDHTGGAGISIELRAWTETELEALFSQLIAAEPDERRAAGLAAARDRLHDGGGLGLPPLPAAIAIEFAARLACTPGGGPAQTRERLLEAWVSSKPIARALGYVWYRGLAESPMTYNWTLDPGAWLSDAPIGTVDDAPAKLATRIVETLSKRAGLPEARALATRLKDNIDAGQHSLLVRRAMEDGALKRGAAGVVPIDPFLARMLVAAESVRQQALPFGPESVWWLRDDADLLARELAIAGYPPQAFFAHTAGIPDHGWVERILVELAFAAFCDDLDATVVRSAWATMFVLLECALEYRSRTGPDEAGGPTGPKSWVDAMSGLEHSVAERAVAAFEAVGRRHAALLRRMTPNEDSTWFEPWLRPQVESVYQILDRAEAPPDRPVWLDAGFRCPPRWLERPWFNFTDEGEVDRVELLAALAPAPALEVVVEAGKLPLAVNLNPWLWPWLDDQAGAGDPYCSELLRSCACNDLDGTTPLPPWPIRAKHWVPDPEAGAGHEQARRLIARGRTELTGSTLLAIATRLARQDAELLLLHVAGLGGSGMTGSPTGLDNALAAAHELGSWCVHERVASLATDLLNGLCLHNVEGAVLVLGPAQVDWQRLQHAFVDIASLDRGASYNETAAVALDATVHAGLNSAKALSRGGAGPEAIVAFAGALCRLTSPSIEVTKAPADSSPRKLASGIGLASPATSARAIGRLDRARHARGSELPADLVADQLVYKLTSVRHEAQRLLFDVDDDALLAVLESDAPDIWAYASSRSGRDRVWRFVDRASQPAIETAFSRAIRDPDAGHDAARWVPRVSLDALRNFAARGPRHPAHMKALARLCAETEGIENEAWRLCRMTFDLEFRGDDAWLRERLTVLDTLGTGIRVRGPQPSAEGLGSFGWKMHGALSHLGALTAVLRARPDCAWVDLALVWIDRLAVPQRAALPPPEPDAEPDDQPAETGWHEQLGGSSAVFVAEGLADMIPLPEACAVELAKTLAKQHKADGVWARLGLPHTRADRTEFLARYRETLSVVWARQLTSEDLRRMWRAAERDDDVDAAWGIATAADERGESMLAARVVATMLERAGPPDDLADEHAIGWMMLGVLVTPDLTCERIEAWGDANADSRDTLRDVIRARLLWPGAPHTTRLRAIYRRWLCS